MSEAILVADGVSKTYRSRATGAAVVALEPISLTITGQTSLGIVGESGAGKSTLLNILLGLLPTDTGSLTHRGAALRPGATRSEEQRRFRREVQVVFQDPRASLDPRMRVGRIIAEPLRALGIGGDHAARVREVLGQVRLDASAMHRHPREFSGGERQRIAIARALAPRPAVLFGDEPLSALDLSTRGEILDLLGELRADLGLGLVLVSHDLAVVGNLCSEVMVLRDARLVEQGPVSRVFPSPASDYVRQLLAAVPKLPEG